MKKSNGFHSTRAIQCFLQQDQIKYYSVESRSSDLKGFFKDKQPMDFWARSGGGLAPTRLAGFLSAIWSFPPRPFCGCTAAIVDSRFVLHPPNPVAAMGIIGLQAADCRLTETHLQNLDLSRLHWGPSSYLQTQLLLFTTCWSDWGTSLCYVLVLLSQYNIKMCDNTVLLHIIRSILQWYPWIILLNLNSLFFVTKLNKDKETCYTK